MGIGASAGGLEAIERMFDHMPSDTGMAFILVQHLSPDFKSLMDELLSRWTSMPIHQGVDGVQVQPNAIYLLPPKKEMAISNGHLLLTDKDPTAPLTLPIDHFFRSLAQDCHRRAIGIVLSGTGTDGSRGVVDIHNSGGLVIVQKDDTAKFDGMPRAARDSGVADLLLAPEDISEALTRYAENPRITDLTDLVEGPMLGATGLSQILTLLRDRYGIDFQSYKLNTVVRRTERRMLLTKTSHVDDYAKRLAEDLGELDLLYKDLLIGVTQFFRDAEAFERLAHDVVSPLVHSTDDGGELRIWVAGCATGEEAYSIAILFDEAIEASGKAIQLKIFATDVHRESLDFAGTGLYPPDRVEDLYRNRIDRYFSMVAGGYQVAPRIRQTIVFAPHNLVKDAPFTKLDLVTCRNLLIYLQPPAQKKIFSLFHFGLKTGGCLFLGPSESPGDVADEFELVDSHWKIYRKRRDMRLPPDVREQLIVPRGVRKSGLPPLTSPHKSSADSLLISTYDALLDEVMPPSLLISEDGTLTHTFGDAGRFLQAEQGRHTSDVMQRLHPDLRLPVSAAIRKTLREQKAVSYESVPVADADGSSYACNVGARVIHDPRNRARSILIQIVPEAHGGEVDSDVETLDAGRISAEQISALETELRYTKENLQATIEELETSNEELQATNEELVASNEELQSTNEELHSVNEELYTVNSEHQNKIAQLSELTKDMDNLLQCTEVHTVFLDRELRIRKFTPRVAESFNFLPQDIGRRIDSFTHSIECDQLAAKIDAVIRSGLSYEEEVRDKERGNFLMRILPYRTAASASQSADCIDGALLTLVEITKLKEASDALQESVRQRDRFLAMLSHELRNPLATIVHAAHLLARGEVPSDFSEAVAIIRRQSQHMSTLLDDLLDVTRVSQGKIQIQKRPFDLLDALRNAVESVQARCRSRSQHIRFHAPHEPVWVRGSQPRMLQVVSNLLTNASKYSPRGAAIELNIEERNGEALVRVIDAGVGIPLDQIEKVFDLFVQSDRTLDRAEGGLGVGLTLARSLVELHGGKVTAHSEGEGKGSEFRVYLPTCVPDREPMEYRQTAMRKRARRVVLVEDNADASKMLAFLLTDTGLEVEIAHDGASGLDLIKDSAPDAAIIDVGLP
ncbi:MAG: PAS domain-containing protein, partial [Planctomycetales bacterium]|nr:PAS domain-containing protein [Planctomycetales bacterium]